MGCVEVCTCAYLHLHNGLTPWQPTTCQVEGLGVDTGDSTQFSTR
jgi:hypothetical protein